MPTLKLICNDSVQSFTFSSGQTIAQVLANNGIFYEQPCGGQTLCGKCKILAKGDLSDISEYEAKALGGKLIKNGYRLACKAVALGDLTLSLEGYAMSGRHQINNVNCCDLPCALCIDLGTTNIELSLVLLNENKKQRAAYKSVESPLVMYGYDVISRAQQSINGKRKEISELLIDTIKNETRKLGVESKSIKEVVVVGNTTMLYLLCGCDCRELVKFPFMMSEKFGIYMTIDKRKRVYIPDCVSAFIGADTVSACVGCDFFGTDIYSKLLIDMGTNGEIVLKTDKGIFATSTAMGPAFEGLYLSCGMKAKPGAIDRVYIKEDKIYYSTVNDEKAVGICASGVVDLISVLKNTGAMDETGRLNKDHRLVNINGGELVFRFENTAVCLSQSDIRYIQEAKSALCAGILSLAMYAKIDISDIKELILTGNFGNYLNINSAKNIGLIPNIPAEKMIFLENSALTGAEKIALNQNFKTKIKKYIKNIKVLNLADDDNFRELYIDCMYF